MKLEHSVIEMMYYVTVLFACKAPIFSFPIYKK